MKKFLNVHSPQSNSFVATAFAVVVTGLLVGGYEVTQAVTRPEASATPVAHMETIVVTAKRG